MWYKFIFFIFICWRTRIAVWVTVIVQFNPIIQRLGDQAVRVGCTLDDNEVPLPRNITIGSSFNFISPEWVDYKFKIFFVVN